MQHPSSLQNSLHLDGAPPTVLVVDDEPVNILVLEGILKSEGFAVHTASSGPLARELAGRIKPDCILLDIMMPGESGFETCAKLMDSPETIDIPIIFISALSDVENKVRGLEIGAVDFIGKPFEKAEVLARVRLHVKLTRAKQALVQEQAARMQQLADAQKAMLVQPEDLPQAKFGVCYLPALEAGGDFYDVFAMNEMASTYFIADICGHDLGASFATSSLKALVRQNSGPLFTPEETLKTINSVLSTVIYGARFLTAQTLYLDRDTLGAVVVSAGHPAPVYYPKGGQPRFLEAPGDVLGVFPAIYLDPLSLEVSPGDRFYLYTDGLLERFTPPSRSIAQGGAELLERIVSRNALPMGENAQAIVRDMIAGHTAIEDDVMLLVAEV